MAALLKIIVAGQLRFIARVTCDGCSSLLRMLRISADSIGCDEAVMSTSSAPSTNLPQTAR
jgi:hypothetical protein